MQREKEGTGCRERKMHAWAHHCLSCFSAVLITSSWSSTACICRVCLPTSLNIGNEIPSQACLKAETRLKEL